MSKADAVIVDEVGAEKIEGLSETVSTFSYFGGGKGRGSGLRVYGY